MECSLKTLNNKIKILIVDDEPDILDLMADEFKYRGYSVNIALSGGEAIQVLKKDTFDIILSDYKMPNGNGMTLLNYVNSLSIRPLFFFVSGQSDMSINDCLSAGAKDFFAKPFDLEIMISEIEKFLNLANS